MRRVYSPDEFMGIGAEAPSPALAGTPEAASPRAEARRVFSPDEFMGLEPDRSAQGWAEAGVRAAAQGALGSVGSAIEGVGVIGRRVGIGGQAVQDAGRAISDFGEEIGPSPEYRGVATDIISGIGSMATYLVPGGAAAAATRGAGALAQGAASIAAASALAGPSGASEAYNRAVEFGLPEDEALKIAMWGIPAGVIQVAPVAVLLRRIPPNLQGQVAGQIRHIAEAFGAEFLAEGAGAWVQNFIEQSYNEERGVWDDTLYQALIGGSAGALTQLGISIATRGRGPFAGGQTTQGRAGDTAPREAPAAPQPAEAADQEERRVPLAGAQEAVDFFEAAQQPLPARPATAPQPAPSALPEGMREAADFFGVVSRPDLLTEGDRASPIPDSLISRGKEIIEAAEQGRAPMPDRSPEIEGVVREGEMLRDLRRTVRAGEAERAMRETVRDGERLADMRRTIRDAERERDMRAAAQPPADPVPELLDTTQPQADPAPEPRVESASPSTSPQQSTEAAPVDPAARWEAMPRPEREAALREAGRPVTQAGRSWRYLPRSERDALATQMGFAPEAPAQASPEASSGPIRAADYARAWNGMDAAARREMAQGIQGMPRNASSRQWGTLPKSARAEVQKRMRPAIQRDREAGAWWAELSASDRASAAQQAGLGPATAAAEWGTLSGSERAALTRQAPRPATPAPAPRARREPTSLLEFLVARGGLARNAEINAVLGTGNRFVAGFGPLVRRQGGMDLDTAREAAAEAGFLGEGDRDAIMARTTIRDLLDAIDREARGGRIAGMRESDAAAITEQADPDQEAAWLEERAILVEEARVEIGELLARLDDYAPADVWTRAAEIMVGQRLSAVDALAEAETEAYAGDVAARVDVDGVLGTQTAEEMSDAWRRFDEAPPIDDAAGDGPVEGRDGPLGDGDGPGAQGGVRAQGPRAGEAGAAEGAGGRGLTTEPGAEGLPQTVIPGAEAVSQQDARSALAGGRARAEAQARQRQSMIRRDGQRRVEDDADGLFGTHEPDMFAERRMGGEPTGPQRADLASAIEGDMRERLDALGLGDVGVRVVDALRAFVNGRPASIDGMYLRRMITVAMDGADMARTLNHEAIHALRDLGLFTRSEWSVLSARAERDWMGRYRIAERYGDLSRAQQIEEAIAHAFPDFVTQNREQSTFARIMQKVRDVMEAIGNALRGAGFQSANDVFAAVEGGEVGARSREGDDATPMMSRRDDAVTEPMASRATADMAKPDAGIAEGTDLAKITGEDATFVKDMGLFAKLAVYPRTLASMSRTFRPVYSAAVEQFQKRDQIVSELSKTARPYMDLKPESKRKVNAVLEIGRLSGQEFAPEADGTIEAVNLDRDTELTARGEVVTLTPEEAQGYIAVRDAMNSALEMFAAQVIREAGLDPAQTPNSEAILRAIPADASAVTRARMETLAQRVAEIEDARARGYVPFTRYGSVVVTVRKPIPEEQQDPISGNSFRYETVWSKTVEVDGLTGMAGLMKAKGKLGQIPAVRKVLDEARALYGRDAEAEIGVFQSGKDGLLQAAGMQASDVDLLAQVANLDPTEQERLQDAYARIQQERGFRSHFFGSRNVPGYSVDFERSIADYIVGIGGYLARRSTNDAWEQAIAGIPGQKPRERKYAETYRDYVNNPTEELAALRQAGFLYFIAGNVSTAALNLTQVPLFTAPYMTMFANPAKVAGALGRAYKDAAGMMSRKAGLDIFTKEKAPTDVREAVAEAFDEGMFVPLVTFEMMGTANNRSQMLRGVNKTARKAIDIIALTYSFAERTNRIATFVAAYRMAKADPEGFRAKAREVFRENPLAREELLSARGEEAFARAYARWIVDETHFRLGKVNRSSVMRGPGAALLQFKSFVLNALELQYRMARNYGRPGKVAFGLHIAALIGTAGIWAIPFGDDLADLMDALYKWWTGIDLDVRTEVRQTIAQMTGSSKLAELATRGTLRMTGVDMSMRIGMGDLIPGSTTEAAGVPFSLTVGKAMQAADHVKRGDLMMGFGELMPNFARNPIHALSWSERGIRSQATGQTLINEEEITAGDVLGKAFGFTSARIAERREQDRAKDRASRATDDLRRSFYTRLASPIAQMERARQRGDLAAVARYERELAEAFERINAHNERVLADGRVNLLITIDQRSLRRRVAQELLGSVVRDTTARRVTRGRRAELEELFNTD